MSDVACLFDDDCCGQEERGDYAQCLLCNGCCIQMAWIPSEFAKVGNLISIKQEAGWEEGWGVSAVYDRQKDMVPRKMPAPKLPFKRNSWLAKRK